MDINQDLKVQMYGLKAKSKKEMYRLLVTDGKLYLPPIEFANHQYIRAILTGKKSVSFWISHSCSVLHNRSTKALQRDADRRIDG